jgi:uncharacterized protein YukE
VTSIWIDPAALRDAVPSFGHLADSVDDALHSLAATLDAEGECWGRDRTGAAFAQSYVDAAAQTRDAFPGLRDAVRGVGRAVSAVADGTDAAETHVQARFSQGGDAQDAGGSGL